MNRQQRLILCGSLVVLAGFSFAMAFEVPVVEFQPWESRPIFRDQEFGPDFLFFRARHRTPSGKYSKELLQTMAARGHRRLEELRQARQAAEEKGMTDSEIEEQNRLGIQDRMDVYIMTLLMVGAEPMEPSNLTLSVLAGIGPSIVLLPAVMFILAGGRGKPNAGENQ